MWRREAMIFLPLSARVSKFIYIIAVHTQLFAFGWSWLFVELFNVHTCTFSYVSLHNICNAMQSSSGFLPSRTSSLYNTFVYQTGIYRFLPGPFGLAKLLPSSEPSFLTSEPPEALAVVASLFKPSSETIYSSFISDGSDVWILRAESTELDPCRSSLACIIVDTTLQE